MTDIPKRGTPEAKRMGCKCPDYGNGYTGHDDGCPLHDEEVLRCLLDEAGIKCRNCGE